MSRNKSPPSTPPRSFALAFGRKRKKVDPYNPESKGVLPGFADTSQASFGGTWSTIDHEAGARQWDPNTESGHARPASWDDWISRPDTSKTAGEDGSSIAFEVRKRFVSDADILEHNDRPRTAFEARNQAALGLGGSSLEIKSIFGGKVQSTVRRQVDERAKLLNRHGSYIDGVNRGQMKKRILEEREARLLQRDEEMLEANKLYREWQALPEAVKASRLENKRRTERFLTESLAFELDEEIPEIYAERGLEKLLLRASIYASSKTSQTSTPVPMPPSPSSHVTPRHDQLRRMERSASIPLSVDTGSAAESWSHGLSLFVDDADPTPPPTQLYKRQRSDLQSPRDTYTRNLPPTTVPVTRSTSSTQSRNKVRTWLQLSDATTDTPSTQVHAETWPEIALIEDAAAEFHKDYDDSQDEAAMRLMAVSSSSARRGRLVVVTLAPTVQTLFAGAVAERLFGGIIQEIQYFPASRQALVVFLQPATAAAFLRHIENIRANDQHEYRRLQLSADWYQGLEHKSVYSSQPSILAAVCVDGASRALLVHNIDRDIKLGPLLHALKQSVRKLIVKARLVVPRKRYVQSQAYSNKIVLEFSAIRDAVEMMHRMNSRTVRDFEHCTAEYLTESTDRRPVRMPFCDCAFCQDERFDQDR